MHADHDEPPRTLNTAALRTVRVLEKQLRTQIDDLRAIACEDLEATDALVFAIESVERALDRARETQRRILRGE